MEDLSVLRKGWDLSRKEDAHLLRSMTVVESVGQWVWMQTAFEWQLKQTAAMFAQDRRTALIELQARLQRLTE